MSKEENAVHPQDGADDFEAQLRAAFADYESSVDEDGIAIETPAASEEAPSQPDPETDSDAEPVQKSTSEPAAQADPSGEEEGVDALIAAKEQRLLAEIYAADPSAEDRIDSIYDLADPERFMKLIKRGYDTADAYALVQMSAKASTPFPSAEHRASAEAEAPESLRDKQSSKNHMRATSSSMRSAGVSDITESEMRIAREALPGVPDKELRKLYRRVS